MARLSLDFALHARVAHADKAWRRIGDLRSDSVGEAGKNVWFACLRPNNILDANAPHKKRVADHRAMTAPGNRFGPHQDTTFSARQVCDPLEVVGKLRRLHVIRVAAKRQIAPTGVWGIRSRVAQPSEARKMHIGYFNRVQ